MPGGGDIGFFAGADIERTEIRLTFFAVNRDDGAPIRAPHGRKSASTAWRCVVAANSRAQIKIKIAGQTSRLSVRREIHDPQIRFRVRLNWFVRRSVERDLFAGGTN